MCGATNRKLPNLFAEHVLLEERELEQADGDPGLVLKRYIKTRQGRPC